MAIRDEGHWIYRAEVVACAANITRPFVSSWTLATALASIGGRVEQQTTAHQQFREICSLQNARLAADGFDDGQDRIETTARVMVAGLNVMDVLTVDSLSLIAAGRYQPSWRTEPVSRRDAQFLAGPRSITGLSIHGQRVEVELQNIVRASSADVERTLIRLMETNNSRVIPVPNFGKVFYDQWMVSPQELGITMLRIELGSPVAGTLIAGAVRVNGNWYP